MKLFFISLLGLFSASNSSAFTMTTSGNVKGWGSNSVVFNVNYTNCSISQAAVNAAIDSAVNLWNSVATSGLVVSRGGSTTATTSSNPPVIYCETNMSGLGLDPDSIPGVSMNAGTSGTKIVRGVIALNSQSGGLANINNVSVVTLNVVLAHEMGHVLGLGHTSDRNALMYYNASQKTELRLSQDDWDGISYLYPRNELGADKFFGCAQIGRMNSSGGDHFQMMQMGFMIAGAWLVTQMMKRMKRIFDCVI